jgi:RND family efflux transporter MFP subunit
MRVSGHTTITLVLLAVATGGCTDKPSAAQGAAPSPQVTVAKPTKRLIAETDEYVGRFVAVDSVEVRARVAGYLATVHFRDGQFVKEGDLLFTIDRRPFEATLAQAQASLAQAKANLAFATSDLERAQRLVGGAVITQQTFDQRTQAKRVAEANVAAQDGQSSPIPMGR